MDWITIYLITIVAIHTVAQLCVLAGLFDAWATGEKDSPRCAAELARLRDYAKNGGRIHGDKALSLIDALEKAREDFDTADDSVAKLVAERDSARTLLQLVHQWDRDEPLRGSILIDRITAALENA